LQKSRLITDFSNLSNQKWHIVNDAVMGGLSHSSFQINSDGNAVFLGVVSLKNNGGFASVKNHEAVNLEGFKSIRLFIKGDGKRYSFRMQTGDDDEIHSWSYEHRFDTNDDIWMEAELPLSGFTATYRGRKPNNAPVLNLSSIKRFGFLISDGQEGEFRLEVDKIEAV
jgi:NADH dehydrogenase [ubiquinone] 1 alpha subcomplex assembly factor 1